MEKMFKKTSSFFNVYSGLPSSIYALFIVRVVTSIASFIGPFLSIYLTSKLGFAKDITGIIMSFNAFLCFPATIFGGYLSDKWNKKNLILIAAFIRVITLFSVIIIQNVYVKVALLMIMSFVSTVSYPIEDTLVADLTDENQRRNTFSLLYLAMNIGISISSIIAGYLFNNFINLMFFIQGTITVLEIFLIYKFVIYQPSNEINQLNLGDNKKNNMNKKTSVLHVLKSSEYIPMFLCGMCIFAFVYNQSGFALPMHLTLIFGEKGPVYFGSLMTLNGLCVVILTSVLTKLTEKVPTAINLSLAGVLYTIGFGMYYFANSYILIAVLTFVWTMGEIIASINFVHYATTHSPEKYRGRVIALTSASMRFGSFLNPLLMGIFIKNFGSKNVWLVTIVIMLLGTSLMLYLHLKEVKGKNMETIYSE